MMYPSFPPSDGELRTAILAALAANARTASADLRVGVLNSIAHLAGTAASLKIRETAEELAKNVSGLDIPILRKCCGLDFKSVLVKGRNNYVCLRKVYNLRSEGGTLIDDKERQQLNDLLDWSTKTQDGSKADLNFVPQDDVWEAIQS